MSKGKMRNRITVRFTDGDLERIKSLSSGKPVATYLRELVMQDKDKTTDDAGNLVTMIRRLDTGKMAQKVSELYDKFERVDVVWFAETLTDIAAKVKKGAGQPDEKSEDSEQKIDDERLRDIFNFIRAELEPIARNASVLGSTLGEITGDTIMIARNLKAPENVKPATRFPEKSSTQDIGEDPLKKIIRNELSVISLSISDALSSAFNAWARTSNAKMFLIENEVTVKAPAPKKGGR